MAAVEVVQATSTPLGHMATEMADLATVEDTTTAKTRPEAEVTPSCGMLLLSLFWRQSPPIV